MDKEVWRKMTMFCLLLAAMSSPVFTVEWKANVEKTLDALVTSCVVVPCLFTHPKETLPSSRLRGIWHRKDNGKQRIYYDDPTQVLDNFRGRTKLLGTLGQNNCTLEINEIKDHDNGPFCFRIELARTETDKPTTDKFSFVEDCVEFKMISDPPKPQLTFSDTIIQGHPYSVTCIVTHTCPSHVPVLKWSRGTSDNIVHRKMYHGAWEVQSVLSFIPEEKDDHTDVTCTSQFHGGKTSSATMKLYVKRAENYNHIIIPSVVGIGTAVIFTVFCIFMVKKYKRRITELQSQDGSMWNRLSRLSRRIRSDGPRGPSNSQQRRSVWSRFSRRPNRDMCGSGQTSNNVVQNFSKPRFPSPKSQAKSCNYKEDINDGDDYINTVDLNIYGNV